MILYKIDILKMYIIELTCTIGDKANQVPCNDIWTEAEVSEARHDEDEFDPRPAPE